MSGEFWNLPANSRKQEKASWVLKSKNYIRIMKKEKCSKTVYLKLQRDCLFGYQTTRCAFIPAMHFSGSSPSNYMYLIIGIAINNVPTFARNLMIISHKLGDRQEYVQMYISLLFEILGDNSLFVCCLFGGGGGGKYIFYNNWSKLRKISTPQFISVY